MGCRHRQGHAPGGHPTDEPNNSLLMPKPSNGNLTGRCVHAKPHPQQHVGGRHVWQAVLEVVGMKLNQIGPADAHHCMQRQQKAVIHMQAMDSSVLRLKAAKLQSTQHAMRRRTFRQEQELGLVTFATEVANRKALGKAQDVGG